MKAQLDQLVFLKLSFFTSHLADVTNWQYRPGRKSPLQWTDAQSVEAKSEDKFSTQLRPQRGLQEKTKIEKS